MKRRSHSHLDQCQRYWLQPESFRGELTQARVQIHQQILTQTGAAIPIFGSAFHQSCFPQSRAPMREGFHLFSSQDRKLHTLLGRHVPLLQKCQVDTNISILFFFCPAPMFSSSRCPARFRVLILWRYELRIQACLSGQGLPGTLFRSSSRLPAQD